MNIVPSRSEFSTLPLEIRLEIYKLVATGPDGGRHYLEAGNVHVHTNAGEQVRFEKCEMGARDTGSILSLAKTCRSVYVGAIGFLYQRIRLVIGFRGLPLANAELHAALVEDLRARCNMALIQRVELSLEYLKEYSDPDVLNNLLELFEWGAHLEYLIISVEACDHFDNVDTNWKEVLCKMEVAWLKIRMRARVDGITPRRLRGKH